MKVNETLLSTTLKIVSERHRVLKDNITLNTIKLIASNYDFKLQFEQGVKNPDGQMTYNQVAEVPLYESDLDDLAELFAGLSDAIRLYQWWTPESDNNQQNSRYRRETPPDLIFFRGNKQVKDNYVIRVIMGFSPVGGDPSVRKTRYTKIQVYKSPEGFQWITEMRNLDRQFKPWTKDNLVCEMNIETFPSLNNVNLPGDKQFTNKLSRLFRNVYDDTYNMMQTHREVLRTKMSESYNGGYDRMKANPTVESASYEYQKAEGQVSQPSLDRPKSTGFIDDLDDFNF